MTSDGARYERRDHHDTVYVEELPKRLFGNLLIDGPDGQCAYIYSGIEERCPKDAAAYTFYTKSDGDSVRVEMCAEHAREDVPEPPTTEQAELVTDGGVTREGLDECWCCGSLHDSLGALCPECDDAGCKHFGGECQSDHKPVLPDGGSAEVEQLSQWFTEMNALWERLESVESQAHLEDAINSMKRAKEAEREAHTDE